jgi:L-ascorbate metabolism protein UlaG (beta-lactamase superfamily)
MLNLCSKIFFFIFVYTLCSQEFEGKNELRILYTGNMGFLLETNGKSVMFDGLHEFYKSDFAYPDSGFAKQLILGESKGFAKVDLLLISHMHKDHFSTKYSVDLLRENNRAYVLGSEQIVESIGSILNSNDTNLKKRIHEVRYSDKISGFKRYGIFVEATKCVHAGGIKQSKIKNITYLVHLDKYKILHVGDTSWDNLKKPLNSLKATEKNIDIAILPYWILSDKHSNEFIKKLLNPKKIIASHIPPYYSEEEFENLKQQFEDIIVMRKIGDIIKYTKQL